VHRAVSDQNSAVDDLRFSGDDIHTAPCTTSGGERQAELILVHTLKLRGMTGTVLTRMTGSVYLVERFYVAGKCAQSRTAKFGSSSRDEVTAEKLFLECGKSVTRTEPFSSLAVESGSWVTKNHAADVEVWLFVWNLFVPKRGL
jgi:hypothetical protein